MQARLLGCEKANESAIETSDEEILKEKKPQRPSERWSLFVLSCSSLFFLLFFLLSSSSFFVFLLSSSPSSPFVSFPFRLRLHIYIPRHVIHTVSLGFLFSDRYSVTCSSFASCITHATQDQFCWPSLPVAPTTPAPPYQSLPFPTARGSGRKFPSCREPARPESK